MTDREMLEFAAKAGGLIVRRNTEMVDSDDRFIGLRVREDVKSPYRTWNPLADDGDALRLAVKLRMSVTVFDNAVGIGIKGDFGYREYDITPDPHAATRWAITHAAAEIGKAMP